MQENIMDLQQILINENANENENSDEQQIINIDSQQKKENQIENLTIQEPSDQLNNINPITNVKAKSQYKVSDFINNQALDSWIEDFKKKLDEREAYIKDDKLTIDQRKLIFSQKAKEYNQIITFAKWKQTQNKKNIDIKHFNIKQVFEQIEAQIEKIFQQKLLIQKIQLLKQNQFSIKKTILKNFEQEILNFKNQIHQECLNLERNIDFILGSVSQLDSNLKNQIEIKLQEFQQATLKDIFQTNISQSIEKKNSENYNKSKDPLYQNFKQWLQSLEKLESLTKQDFLYEEKNIKTIVLRIIDYLKIALLRQAIMKDKLFEFFTQNLKKINQQQQYIQKMDKSDIKKLKLTIDNTKNQLENNQDQSENVSPVQFKKKNLQIKKQIIEDIQKIQNLIENLFQEQQVRLLVSSTAYKTNKMIRYTGDMGKITSFHFLLNQANLKPVLQEIDPSVFKEKRQQTFSPMKKKKNIQEQNQKTEIKNQKINNTNKIGNIDNKDIEANNEKQQVNTEEQFEEGKEKHVYSFNLKRQKTQFQNQQNGEQIIAQQQIKINKQALQNENQVNGANTTQQNLQIQQPQIYPQQQIQKIKQVQFQIEKKENFSEQQNENQIKTSYDKEMLNNNNQINQNQDAPIQNENNLVNDWKSILKKKKINTDSNITRRSVSIDDRNLQQQIDRQSIDIVDEKQIKDLFSNQNQQQQNERQMIIQNSINNLFDSQNISNQALQNDEQKDVQIQKMKEYHQENLQISKIAIQKGKQQHQQKQNLHKQQLLEKIQLQNITSKIFESLNLSPVATNDHMDTSMNNLHQTSQISKVTRTQPIETPIRYAKNKNQRILPNLDSQSLHQNSFIYKTGFNSPAHFMENDDSIEYQQSINFLTPTRTKQSSLLHNESFIQNNDLLTPNYSSKKIKEEKKLFKNLQQKNEFQDFQNSIQSESNKQQQKLDKQLKLTDKRNKTILWYSSIRRARVTKPFGGKLICRQDPEESRVYNEIHFKIKERVNKIKDSYKEQKQKFNENSITIQDNEIQQLIRLKKQQDSIQIQSDFYDIKIQNILKNQRYLNNSLQL